MAYQKNRQEHYLAKQDIRFEHLLEDSQDWGRQSFVTVPGCDKSLNSAPGY